MKPDDSSATNEVSMLKNIFKWLFIEHFDIVLWIIIVLLLISFKYEIAQCNDHYQRILGNYSNCICFENSYFV